MRIQRNTLRAVLPPVLAIGLAALVVHPVDALPAASSDALPTTGSVAAPARVVTQDPAGNLSVSLPAVAFQEKFRVEHGHLRTAVLVNASGPAARASVRQIPGCTIALAPGVVGWLDCTYSGRTAITIDVALADGRHVARSDVPVGL